MFSFLFLFLFSNYKANTVHDLSVHITQVETQVRTQVNCAGETENRFALYFICVVHAVSISSLDTF